MALVTSADTQGSGLAFSGWRSVAKYDAFVSVYEYMFLDGQMCALCKYM